MNTLKSLIYSSIIISFYTIFISVAYSAQDERKYDSIKNIPQSTFDKLSQKKIYFAHHSVGENILQGVSELLKENKNIKLNIISSNDVGQSINAPALVHGGVGRNFKPYSKLESFEQKMEQGYGHTADIVFFKFCFVDFNPETDINALFNTYKETLDKLQAKYPRTTFVVITVPLTCYAPGIAGIEKRIKDLSKKIIGKSNIYDHSSANRFNELLIEQYQGKLPIFDLAKFESTRPDGSRVGYQKDGTQYFELAKEYTIDGGHLNENGRRRIAEQFLLFLSGLADPA
jgi:lysophospholipase L1-like esterase